MNANQWTQIKETQTAYWFKNSAGEILSVPKNEKEDSEFYRHDLNSPQGL